MERYSPLKGIEECLYIEIPLIRHKSSLSNKSLSYRKEVEDEDDIIDESYGMIYNGEYYIHFELEDLENFLKIYGGFAKMYEIHLNDRIISVFFNGLEKLISYSKKLADFTINVYNKDGILVISLGEGFATKIYFGDLEELALPEINTLPDNYLRNDKLAVIIRQLILSLKNPIYII